MRLQQLPFLFVVLLSLTLALPGCGLGTSAADSEAPDGDDTPALDGDTEAANTDKDTEERPLVCFPGVWACVSETERGLCDEYGEGYEDSDSCGSYHVCVNGECIAEGDPLCTPGASGCYDDHTRATCREDGYDWESGSFVVCGSGQACVDGECVVLEDGDSEATSEPDSSEESDVTDTETDDTDLPPDTETDDTEAPIEDGDQESVDQDSEAPIPDGDSDSEAASDTDDTDTLPVTSPFYSCLPLHDQALITCLYEQTNNQTALGYTNARKKMYGDVDLIDGTKVQCVYTGVWYTTNGDETPTAVNAEHTWPQSYGAENEPLKSDLNHLFPTTPSVNSRRSNYPFNTVTTVSWQQESKFGKDSQGRTVWEPRDAHKGDVARAIFYVYVRYASLITNEPYYDMSVLKAWNHADPPDAKERNRLDKIESYQHKRNPFVDYPAFADHISQFPTARKAKVLGVKWNEPGEDPALAALRQAWDAWNRDARTWVLDGRTDRPN